MKRLTEIGLKKGTDKATYHNFTEYYDDIFSLYKSPRILEIGIYNFSSLDMYLEYFDEPYVMGMDIDDKSHFLNDKWKFVRGDQSLVSDLSKCVVDNEPFDIIVDDGGHSMKQQQISFGYLIDYINPGGYYILEDLHTSLMPEYINHDCQFTSLEMLRKITNNETYFSNYIDRDQQIKILSKIDSIKILQRDPNIWNDSVTSIIKIK